jgi:hypothetical protein
VVRPGSLREDAAGRIPLFRSGSRLSSRGAGRVLTGIPFGRRKPAGVLSGFPLLTDGWRLSPAGVGLARVTGIGPRASTGPGYW